ncbi:baseplate J/gp47 family protein [Rubrolithibacter danxiaensis]|uniref:baseplate J/gp47 family protein n=1 Tax=Rubrolithibacter danxiaensis TaxID=3390805 RepID=UPI003BF84358
MSSKAIDYKVILKRDGQAQQERMPPWLDPALIKIDPRKEEDFYNYARSLASGIKFYDADMLAENGTWADFFSLSFKEIENLASKASVPSHLALWQSFQKLYGLPQELLNGITKRHLDFYYGEVLKLQVKSPVPDKAHVIFELKKNTADTLLPAGTVLLAGKDEKKQDLHYRLMHDIVVNQSKVAALKSLYINPANKNFIHFAPVANSADGLGGELDKNNLKWQPLGYAGLPLAQIGFCLASPVLNMKEGEREIMVKLTLRNLPEITKNEALTSNLFTISLTGEKGWIGPKAASAKVSSPDNITFTLTFSIILRNDEPAIAPYQIEIHGHRLETVHPALQVLLNNEKADFSYQALSAAELIDATIEVSVQGIKNLQLENDQGALDSKKPFLPFGASPAVNAGFSIGYDESFSKRLKEFSIDVEWKNIPSGNLGSYFSDYPGLNKNNNFTASAAFKDGSSWEQKAGTINLFNAANAQSATTWRFVNPDFPVKVPILKIPDIAIRPQLRTGTSLSQSVSSNLGQLVPAFAPLQLKAGSFAVQPYLSFLFQPMLLPYREAPKGRLSLRLHHTFFFKEYREKYTAEILRYSKNGGTLNLPAEPFAPEMLSIALNYTATTVKTPFSGTTLNDFVDEDIEFFQYGAFGQMREHAYSRSCHPFLNNTSVKLLPEYTCEGEFFIGFEGLKAEDAACVLFEAAEGSANPDKPKVNLSWSVLCDNYWKMLTNEDFIFDTTNALLTSGVIKFVIPREATTGNTLMPDGLLWIKASASKDSDGVCNLTDVQANAAIAEFEGRDNDTGHLAKALPAGTINKLEPENGAIKSVKQAYASFGGQMQEQDSAYYIRVAERLRHKERSIANWDYERLILQYFPRIYKVKCINHASETSFYEPGHTLIIVIPDLTNKNAADPFRPKTDKNTLDTIYNFLVKHSSAWVTHHVSNPYYEPVKVSVRIKLKAGFEFNFYEKVISQRLQEFLSPWISSSASSSLHFGGKVSLSMIVKFLEDMEFVDFIADLKLFHWKYGDVDFGNSTGIAEASNPAAILVSHHRHEIINY